MALTYTGTGGLFTRLGYMAGLVDKAQAYQASLSPTSATATTGIRTLYGAMAAGAANYPYGMPLIPRLADEERQRRWIDGHLRELREDARNFIIKTIDANSAGARPILTLREAITELAAQMELDSATIEKTTFTIGAPSYGGGNVGDSIAVLSAECREIIGGRVNFASKLVDWPHIRPETVRMQCVSDARGNAVRPGSEVWRVQGQRAYPFPDYRFPGGSGLDYEIAATSADVDGGDGPTMNILTHSDMESVSSNVPVNWSLTAGSAGTHWVSSASAKRRGTLGMQMVGDGATSISIRQQLGIQTGTLGRLKPDTIYLLSFFVKDGAAAPGSGTVTLRLYDGSSTIGSMTVSASAASVGASWYHAYAVVQSPINIPTTVYAQLYASTAIENAKDFYVDDVTISELHRPAPGCWGLNIIAGATDTRLGDTATVAVSYNASGDWQLAIDELFDLYGMGLALPSATAGAETIADSLIVNP